MDNRSQERPSDKARAVRPEPEDKLKTEQKQDSGPASSLRRISGRVARPQDVLSLQQTIGNQAVQRLLESGDGRPGRPEGSPAIQKKPDTGVIQRHVGSVPWYAADRIHGKLSKKIDNRYESSKKITEAYYNHNHERINGLDGRVSALEGKGK